MCHCHTSSVPCSKSHFKVLSPTLQGTPPGVPPQGGTLKVLPCHPTLDPRPERGVPPDHPTLDLRRQRRWGGGDLGTQGGGGGGGTTLRPCNQGAPFGLCVGGDLRGTWGHSPRAWEAGQ